MKSRKFRGAGVGYSRTGKTQWTWGEYRLLRRWMPQLLGLVVRPTPSVVHPDKHQPAEVGVEVHHNCWEVRGYNHIHYTGQRKTRNTTYCAFTVHLLRSIPIHHFKLPLHSFFRHRRRQREFGRVDEKEKGQQMTELRSHREGRLWILNFGFGPLNIKFSTVR